MSGDGKRRIDPAPLMQSAMRALAEVFPGCAVVVLVAPFDGPPDARVNYIASAKREDIVAMMKETVARFEGRGHDAPERPQ